MLYSVPIAKVITFKKEKKINRQGLQKAPGLYCVTWRCSQGSGLTSIAIILPFIECALNTSTALYVYLSCLICVEPSSKPMRQAFLLCPLYCSENRHRKVENQPKVAISKWQAPIQSQLSPSKS